MLTTPKSKSTALLLTVLIDSTISIDGNLIGHKNDTDLIVLSENNIECYKDAVKLEQEANAGVGFVCLEDFIEVNDQLS